MASLIFGSADYITDIRCQPEEDRHELLLALQMIVIAARSAGIDAIDAPCFDIHNRDLLNKEAAHSRRLGFDGKSALHPDQLDTINRIFDVTTEEIGEPFRLEKPARLNAEAVEAGTQQIMEHIAALLPEGHRGYYEYISHRDSESVAP